MMFNSSLSSVRDLRSDPCYSWLWCLVRKPSPLSMSVHIELLLLFPEVRGLSVMQCS